MLFCIWFLAVVSFIFFSYSLLLSLLLLEILSFLLLAVVWSAIGSFLLNDVLLLAFFCIFVIEGVIALSGLISVVTSSGSDYVSSSSLLK